MKKGLMSTIFLLVILALSIFIIGEPGSDGTVSAVNAMCVRTITTDVVALDQPFYFNRLGAINPNGMMYALTRDVVVSPNQTPAIDPATGLPFVFPNVGAFAGLTIPEFEAEADAQALGLTRADLAGQVALRSDKRPRPLTLRMNEGDCMDVTFTNLLDPIDFIFNLPGEFPTGQILGLGVPTNPQIADQPLTRLASIHIDGLYLEGDINSDGSNVGENADINGNGILDAGEANGSLVAPGESTVYSYHAEHEATHLMYSMGATMGADGAGGSRTYGLFGAVNVQKQGAEWYRSQVTRQEMDWATPPEVFTDWNGNGVWDAAIPEPLTDWNGNGVQDNAIAEPLTDWNGNGVQDNGIAEPLTDWNGNGLQDNGIAEPLTDWNGNSLQDNGIAEPFTDSDGNGAYDLGEPYTDWNGNGIWDASVNEPYTDWNGSGVWDGSVNEPYTDWNGSGVWDGSVDEPYTDWNGTGVWEASVNEPYTDWNGNGIWDATVSEPLVDTNGDGVFNAHRTTPDGQPLLDYDAVYPAEAGPGKAGLPIINMLDGTELVHTDINAIITGPNRGRFDQAGVTPYLNNEAAGDRNAPYREFTVIFHDDQFAVQAFPGFYNDPVLGHTLAGVADAFPINYGSGGIGSEIIANRLGVGPMWDCAECKYEEFFLTSWTVGDPAMIVDKPANADFDGDGQPDPGAKATKALFPDDPSNVHHSYLSDRVKFRNLHAGPKEHHIFHLHAHQWLFNPDDPQSNYLDGQALGPGSGYTYEIAYGGSGNRNKTAGDSIFHCHFYPHFAQGMWEMWRVHDTFEQGTIMELDPADGLPIPAAGSRALPDGEIAAGTPIPGVVPIPTNPMAPMPDAAAQIVASDLNGDTIPDSSQFDANGDGTADIFQVADQNAAPATNPGYPWYIPGLLGHRPPTPAFDMDPDMDGSSLGFDGGLPRHVISSGPDEDNPAHAGTPVEMYVSRLDFNKVLHEASAIQIPEGGTAAEQVAMNFHSQQFWPTYSPELNPALN
jgi:hypothetical protein